MAKAPKAEMTFWALEGATALMEECDRWKARALAAEARLAALEAALPRFIKEVARDQRYLCAEALPSSPKDFVGMGARVMNARLSDDDAAALVARLLAEVEKEGKEQS